MIRRFDLLDSIVNLSRRPVSAYQASWRAAAEEGHHNTDEGGKRRVESAVVTRAVGTIRHSFDVNMNIVSRAKHLYAIQDGPEGGFAMVWSDHQHVGSEEVER